MLLLLLLCILIYLFLSSSCYRVVGLLLAMLLTEDTLTV